MSIKEVFKFLTNIKLCKETNRKLEQNQDGILVNVFFEHDREKEEVDRLKKITPKSGPNPSNKKYVLFCVRSFKVHYVHRYQYIYTH